MNVEEIRTSIIRLQGRISDLEDILSKERDQWPMFYQKLYKNDDEVVEDLREEKKDLREEKKRLDNWKKEEDFLRKKDRGMLIL